MLRMFILCMLFCVASSPARSEVKHYLVDNSGSMTNYRNSVDQEISRLIENKHLGQDVAVTYFQGASRTDCESQVVLAEPRPAQAPFELAPPSAGGSTLITKALQALGDVPISTEIPITLYSDGSFEDSACETPEDICSAVSELRRKRPELQIEFQYPPHIRASGKAVLTCAGSPDPKKVIEPMHNYSLANSTAEKASRSAVEYHWPTIVSWISLPLLFVGWVGLNIYSRRRYTESIKQSDEIEDPKKIATNWERRASWFFSIIFAAVIVCLISFAVRRSETWSSFFQVYEEANRPLLAIVFAWVLTVVSGWYFIEILNDSRARQDKQWRLQEKTALERAEKSAVSRIHDQFTERFEKYQEDQANKVLLASQKMSEENRERLSAMFDKMEIVQSRLSEIVSKIKTYSTLNRHESGSYFSIRSLTKLLLAAGRIEKSQESKIIDLFNNWRRVLLQAPAISENLEQEILHIQLNDLFPPDEDEV